MSERKHLHTCDHMSNYVNNRQIKLKKKELIKDVKKGRQKKVTISRQTEQNG